MKLNENILYYRKAAKLSQEELAAQVGVSRQAVSKWELGDAVPELDKLLALARVFGVTTDELLSESAPAASQEQDSSSEEEPPHIRPDAPAEDRAGRLCGLAGRLVRRFGWLAGVCRCTGWESPLWERWPGGDSNPCLAEPGSLWAALAAGSFTMARRDWRRRSWNSWGPPLRRWRAWAALR